MGTNKTPNPPPQQGIQGQWRDGLGYRHPLARHTFQNLRNLVIRNREFDTDFTG